MARGRNLQAFVKGYLKGEVAKQEQAAEQARLLREAEQKKASEKLAFNSNVVKGVITQNPEMFKELNMGYDQLTSDAGLQTVLSYVKDKDTNTKLKDTYLNAAVKLMTDNPEQFKNFNVNEYDATTAKGQQDLFMAAVKFSKADEETGDKDKYKGYRVYGKDTPNQFQVRFNDSPNTFEEYYANGNNIVNALKLNEEKYNKLSKEQQIEIAQTLENSFLSASSLHLSNQSKLKVENTNHEVRDIQWSQIERLEGSKTLNSYRDFLVNLKQNSTYDLIKAVSGQMPTMVGKRTNENGEEETTANYDETGELGVLMDYVSTKDYKVVNEKDLSGLYPELVTEDNSIFKLAQTIISLPGMRPDTPYRDNPAAKSLLHLNKNAFSLTPSMRKIIGVTMLDAIEQGMPQEEAMLSLGLAINRKVGDGKGMLFSKTNSINKDYARIIKQVTKLSGEDGIDKIKSMRNNAKDALELSKKYLGLIKNREIKVGIAGFIDNKVVNLIGEDGTLDSVLGLFNGDNAEFGKDTFYEGGSARMQEEIKLVNSEIKNVSKEKRKAYGEAAALRIYLAYTLAKVFDPSGRVSDKDLDNVLSAFAGDGNIVSPQYVEGMLGISIERLTSKFNRFDMLSNYDPSNVNRSDVQRMTGAIAFEHIMSSTNAEVVKDKMNVVENMSVGDYSPLGLEPKPNLSYVDDNNIKRNVFQVFRKHDKQNVSPIFKSTNNLYVYIGGDSTSQLVYIPSADVQQPSSVAATLEKAPSSEGETIILNDGSKIIVDLDGNPITQ